MCRRIRKSSTRCSADAIETAQKKIESNNFGIRKNLLEYDQVMNEQREIIYAERRRVLDGESMRDVIYKMITDIVDNTVDMVIGEDADVEEWNFKELNSLLLPIIPLVPVTKEQGEQAEEKQPEAAAEGRSREAV